MDYRESAGGVLVPASGVDTNFVERIAELELAIEDQGWLQLAGAGETEFSRSGLMTITRLSRLSYIKNPLINRGVSVKADYVFGRGVNLSAKDDTINTLLQKFLDDPHNQAEFTSQQARIQKEVELETDGNLFFVLFVHPATGRVRVRSIPADEVTDIITDPEDAKKPWYYKRVYKERRVDLDSGEATIETRTRWYRDWRYRNDTRQTVAGQSIEPATVYHVKIGGFSDWRFGVGEVYSAIDWSKAYKTFLENWSSITAAYARYAWKLTTDGGRAGVAAAKAKIGTRLGVDSGTSNPAPTTASTFIAQQGKADLEPVRTSGATTDPGDGRRLLLMVAAGLGLPETFFGDVSVGTLATAKSLDRPTELAFVNRQTLWVDIYHDIIEFIKYHAVRAPQGPLRLLATIKRDEYGEEYLYFGDGEDAIDPHVDIDFPSIVEHDLATYISAISTAAPYVPDARELARLVLNALAVNDVDELLDRMYPPDAPDAPDAAPDATSGLVSDDTADPLLDTTADLLSATEGLRTSINYLVTALRESAATNVPV